MFKFIVPTFIDPHLMDKGCLSIQTPNQNGSGHVYSDSVRVTSRDSASATERGGEERQAVTAVRYGISKNYQKRTRWGTDLTICDTTIKLTICQVSTTGLGHNTSNYNIVR